MGRARKPSPPQGQFEISEGARNDGTITKGIPKTNRRIEREGEREKRGIADESALFIDVPRLCQQQQRQACPFMKRAEERGCFRRSSGCKSGRRNATTTCPLTERKQHFSPFRREYHTRPLRYHDEPRENEHYKIAARLRLPDGNVA